jgi:ribosomal protein S18 acetylase RimI-like enzyme
MMIRPIAAGDRAILEQAVTASFVRDEVAVALELIDASIAGSDDYQSLVASQVEGAPHGIGGYLCYGPTPMTRATYDLYWIVTHPDARGRGVAGALISAMEAALRGAGATGVRVETSETESYGAARRLYQRLGYPRAAHLRDFYRPGDGLIIYYKQL